MTYSWQRYGGYECSSKGDARFSAFHAGMPDGRSIEQHYQCDVKGYDPGGRNWRLGKGKPARDPRTDLWAAYLELWRTWASTHQEDLSLLAVMAMRHGCILSDRFATTDVNQAHALAVILTETSATA